MDEEKEVVIEENVTKKDNKKMIITIVSIVVVIALIVGIVNIVRPTPEKTVKKFVESINKGKVADAFKCIDFQGMYAFSKLDKNEYEDFYDTYKDLNDDDDWQEIKEELDDQIEDTTDEISDEIENMEQFSVEVKEIKSTKKVSDSKVLYKVKAKVKAVYKEDSDSDTERETEICEFYLMKIDGKYKLVGASGDSMISEIFNY